MARVALFDNDGNRLDGIKVTIAYPKKQAPYSRFKVVNLDKALPLRAITGLQAKVLLALIFAPSELETKEIAALVGCTTSAACRALVALTAQGLVSKVSRGQYRVNSSLAHFGRWSVPHTQHPQGRDGTE